ncbi:GDP-D-glucose phosphorylase 1 [Heptranchias perlo]|uniref:GDP-D-glucose phosphorylase 1 n=1 Tax=Heptranchias perlo TaxID=212740 RepID=UPI00355A9A7C
MAAPSEAGIAELKPADGAAVNGEPEQARPWTEAEVFAYSEGDFFKSGVRWGRPGTRCRFDAALRSAWADRMSRGCFRYALRGPELLSRVLPGPRRFVAQLNVSRGTERRRPQEILSLRQPFDPNQFNFGKIRPREILFALRRGGAACPGDRLTGQGGALLIINVSPLEYGHVLLLPDPARALPQVLTGDSLLQALELVFLSSDPGFRMGFNSLGAFASVNHLHLHGYYLGHELEVESAPTEPLAPGTGFNRAEPELDVGAGWTGTTRDQPGPGLDKPGLQRAEGEREPPRSRSRPRPKPLHRVHLLSGHPTRGLVLYTDGTDIPQTAAALHRITDFFLGRSLAHNLFLTRGCPLGGRVADPGSRDGVRLILWPRRSCFGVKEESAFNVALCELAGHLPIKTPHHYSEMTEGKALEIIRKHLLSEEELSQLRSEITGLLED